MLYLGIFYRTHTGPVVAVKCIFSMHTSFDDIYYIGWKYRCTYSVGFKQFVFQNINYIFKPLYHLNSKFGDIQELDSWILHKLWRNWSFKWFETKKRYSRTQTVPFFKSIFWTPVPIRMQFLVTDWKFDCHEQYTL